MLRAIGAAVVTRSRQTRRALRGMCGHCRYQAGMHIHTARSALTVPTPDMLTVLLAAHVAAVRYAACPSWLNWCVTAWWVIGRQRARPVVIAHSAAGHSRARKGPSQVRISEMDPREPSRGALPGPVHLDRLLRSTMVESPSLPRSRPTSTGSESLPVVAALDRHRRLLFRWPSPGRSERPRPQC
jgi:hypothetical protein